MWARWTYSGILYAASPLLALRLYQRGRKNPAYLDRPAERFGWFSGDALPHSLWVHTVSVGEFLAARPMIDWMLRTWPGRSLVVTTMTPTGAERVRATYLDPASKDFCERVRHVYLPYDFPHAVTQLLDHINPDILVIMETELWPNLVHAVHARGVPVVVANARLSERSARGYAKLGALTRSMLQEIDVIAAQSGADGERFIGLGLPHHALQVTGTVKFDLVIDEAIRQQAKVLRERWGSERNVFIAASTHPGEDEQIIEALRVIKRALPNVLLVLVPRHPERFQPVAELLQRHGLRVSRHSLAQRVDADTDVVLGDTMGELLVLLGASDLAFVGGSFVPVGGHNMLEPLAMGVPAITGPHVFNFQVVAGMLTREGVLKTVSSESALADAVVDLFRHPQQRQMLAAKGVQVVDQHRGALARLCTIITGLLRQKAP